MENNKKYVVLEHLTLPDRGLRFWSCTNENINLEWYKIILYTDDEEEAIKNCTDHNLTRIIKI